jgi:hypothetical protein
MRRVICMLVGVVIAQLLCLCEQCFPLGFESRDLRRRSRKLLLEVGLGSEDAGVALAKRRRSLCFLVGQRSRPTVWDGEAVLGLERLAVLRGEPEPDRRPGGVAETQQDCAESLARPLLLVECRIQLRLSQHPSFDQDPSEGRAPPETIDRVG